LVRFNILADVLQRVGGKLLDAPSSFTLRYPSLLVEEFLQ